MNPLPLAERRLKPSPFLPDLAEIIRKDRLTATETLYRLRLADGSELGHTPGQFLEVSVLGIGEAPFSISSSPTRGEAFELCIRRVGDVTKALERLELGSMVGVRGPLGRGFPLSTMRKQNVLVIAGGLGIVPLRSLITNLIDERDDFDDVTILYGCKNPGEMLFKDEIAQWVTRDDVDFRVTTDIADPGWKGNVGPVTTLFRRLEVHPARTVPVMVGPPVMFKHVVKQVLACGVPEDRIVLSLERRMKCGIGECGHCQINGVYVCQDGPVFTYAELKRLEEAML
ncbi:MAG: FAD/NAD(P)-binding protein [Thermoleophilia bacterium]|nr:FAD/NAD(P)-binding protein [Thermoleophilia bacterium]